MIIDAAIGLFDAGIREVAETVLHGQAPVLIKIPVRARPSVFVKIKLRGLLDGVLRHIKYTGCHLDIGLQGKAFRKKPELKGKTAAYFHIGIRAGYAGDVIL